MKKHYFYFSLLAIAAMAVAATSCSKEEIDSPSTNPGNDPTVEVPDPEGTILISMRNNGDTYLDNNFYIDNANNFSGGYFTSLGEMKGLDNVTRIPKHGWGNKAAVVPSTGYVACNSYGHFYRLFVTSYTVNSMNEIIGADVKYQTPFYPTETIKLPLQVLEFGQDGGAQNIVFGNENIIPFNVSSSADWCQVYTSSTLNYSFLIDGIFVEVTPNEGAQREATVSILDGNNNIQEISIIQAGAEPYLSLSQDTLLLPYPFGVMFIGVMTNYHFDDLSVTSSAEWCQATLEPYGGEMLARMNEQVRFKGKERVTDKSNYGTSSYTLSVSASSDNDGETPREATVTVASKDGSNKAELKVKPQITDTPGGVYGFLSEGTYVWSFDWEDSPGSYTGMTSGSMTSATQFTCAGATTYDGMDAYKWDISSFLVDVGFFDSATSMTFNGFSFEYSGTDFFVIIDESLQAFTQVGTAKFTDGSIRPIWLAYLEGNQVGPDVIFEYENGTLQPSSLTPNLVLITVSDEAGYVSLVAYINNATVSYAEEDAMVSSAKIREQIKAFNPATAPKFACKKMMNRF